MSGRINPFALSRAFSSDSSDMDSVSSPRAKFVSTCMNCNYTFRRGSSVSTDFCSKDCQTCYLIYISNPAHTPKKFRQEEKSGKQLVYEFQRQLDRQNDEAARQSDEEKMVEIHELRSSPVKITATKRGWFAPQM